ncbi:hypothetical protein ACT7CZ_19300, partial [Bacillus cereus]
TSFNSDGVNQESWPVSLWFSAFIVRRSRFSLRRFIGVKSDRRPCSCRWEQQMKSGVTNGDLTGIANETGIRKLMLFW